VTSRAAWLRGTVGGAALPTTLTYEVNGGGETVVPLDPSGGGAFGFAVPLRPGANEVVVRAAGAEVRRSFSFGSRTTAGGLHTGALRSGGAYAWGRNNRGQLGLGPAATDDGHVPAPLPDSGDVGWLWFGQNSSLAVRRDGTLWAWGENDDGQLGLGSAAAPDVEPRNAPTRVAGVAGVVAAALGFGHGLALLADGTLVAFGADNRGQLGDGEAGADRSAPGPVVDLTDVVKVVGGAQHSVALRADGTVWAWGRNGFGALGLGAIDDEPHPRPAPVPGLAGVVDVATGRDHVLALRADGTVWAWGLNENGQVGDGTSGGPDRASPAAVAGLADAVAVYANGSTSFALKADGTLWGWGQNFNGQLGIGEDKNDKPAPSAPVVGLADVVGVGPGPTHVVAERGDGSLFVWGWSARGSLGGADLLENWPYPEPVALPLAP
jgi:alpha-tubulin suppressor-like RCC1 family protein